MAHPRSGSQVPRRRASRRSGSGRIRAGSRPSTRRAATAASVAAISRRSSTAHGRSASAVGPLVLVVDDDERMRELMRVNLELAGYSVREAESGELALRRSKKQAPDLVLLDVVMPGLDGWQLLRRLEERHGSIPVIMFSGLVDERPPGRRARRPRLHRQAVRPRRAARPRDGSSSRSEHGEHLGWDRELESWHRLAPGSASSIPSSARSPASGNAGAVWLVLALLAAFVRWGDGRYSAWVAVADSVAQSSTALIQHAVGRHRPRVHTLIAEPHSSSFPSGHTASSFACAVVLHRVPAQVPPAALRARRADRAPRLYVGVHYPLDVLAGALWGIGGRDVILQLEDARPVFPRRSAGGLTGLRRSGSRPPAITPSAASRLTQRPMPRLSAGRTASGIVDHAQQHEHGRERAEAEHDEPLRRAGRSKP